MASEAVGRFLEVLATDTALQQEVEAAVAAGSERLDAAMAVARGHGYEFTADELKLAVEAQKAGGAEGLSEAELEGVAGGVKGWISYPRDPSRR